MRTTVPCPTCRQPSRWADNPWRPFCSERCRLLDLGHWAQERYRVPGDPVSETTPGDSEDREGNGES